MRLSQALQKDLLKRYLFALALAGAALLLHAAVRPWVGQKIPFMFFMPAVVVAAALAGRGPALLVLSAGLLNAMAWLAPHPSLRVDDPQDQLAVGIYLLFALLMAEFGNVMRLKARRAVEAEDRLGLAIEDTAIGLFDVDLVAATVYLSPSLMRLAGLPPSPASMPLAQWLAGLPPDAVAESRALLAGKLREGARSYERELSFTPPDGRPRWLLLRVHLVWQGARVTHLRGACVDITERKQTDAELQHARAELSQQVDDLHRLHELSSRLLEAGTLQAQLRMILHTLAEFHHTGRGLVSLIDAQTGLLAVEVSQGIAPDSLALLAQARARQGLGPEALAHAQRQRLVVEDVECSGQLGEVLEMARREGIRAIHSTPLISPRGEVLGAISVHFEAPHTPDERERTLADICARKAAVFIERARTDAALEEARDRFERVLEASAVPFSVLAPLRGADGRIIDFRWNYLNGAGARLIGHPAPALIGRTVGEILPRAWVQDPLSFEAYVAAIELRQTREFESRAERDGLPVFYHCIASPMQDAVAVWFADITDRKRDELLLHEADRRKDEFLATLAHELRNPLAPIRQAAVLSRMPDASEAQKRWSHEVIDRQVQHMALLLDDLLDISRITRGVLTLRRSATELTAVVEAAVETARPLIDARRHRLSLELPGRPLRFEADMLRLSQVVANLLTNAAKYTEPGGHIRLKAGRAGGELVIEVSDDGIGIPAGSLHEIFTMFTQLRHGGEHAGGGLGIGLALTQGLVELHGGRVEAHSAGPGQGSRFVVHLPIHAVTEAAAANGDGGPLQPPAPRRLLVADDNRDAAESLGMLLELQGHAVVLAFDGRQALEAYRRAPAEICLLDIGMPHLSGNDVARAIRALPGGERPVLVAITGWGQQGDVSEAMAAGFDHHLTKPVDPDALARLLLRC